MDIFILERTVPPDDEVVTLEELRVHIGEFANVTEKNTKMTALIKMAREWAEQYTGRALLTQTWRLTIGDQAAQFANVDSDTVQGYYRGPYYARSDGGILLRRAPVASITSIASVNGSGVETAIASANYELREADSKWPRVVPIVGSLTGNLRITYVAGWTDTEDVPERFRQAILIYAEAMYDRDPKEMPALISAAEHLLDPESSNLQLA